MNYKIAEKPELLLTGYKCHFDNLPHEGEAPEDDVYVKTRTLQYLLMQLSKNYTSHFNVIANVDDEGFEFYIALSLAEYPRDNLANTDVFGPDLAKYYEMIRIPRQTYAIFDVDQCSSATLTYFELRQQLATKWHLGSGEQPMDAPGIVLNHQEIGSGGKSCRREFWIPIQL